MMSWEYSSGEKVTVGSSPRIRETSLENFIPVSSISPSTTHLTGSLFWKPLAGLTRPTEMVWAASE